MSEPFTGSRPLPEALTSHPRGLFTDIDGTISRIAPSPEAASLLPEIPSMLRAARNSFEVVAVVSGRNAEDAARMVGDPGLLYIGNHGFEIYEPATGSLVQALAAAPFVSALQNLLAEIGPELEQSWPGLRVERKGPTASIHVRETAAPADAEEDVYQRVLAGAAQVGGIRVTRGRLVVELRPDMDIDKGTAVTDVIHQRRLRAAIYIGDDLTDVAAFRALRRLDEIGECRGVSVAVYSPEASPQVAGSADLVIAGIDEVPAFFRWLLDQ